MPTATTTNVAYTASAQTTQGFSLSTRPTVSRGDIPVNVNRLERSWKRQLLRKKVTFIVPFIFYIRAIVYGLGPMLIFKIMGLRRGLRG